MSSMNIQSERAGKVARITVSPNQRVSAGQPLPIFKTMKMDIPVDAPEAASVAEICVTEGGTVKEGQLLARLQA